MEAKTSTLQAEVFSHMAAQMSYRVDSGPSERILFPKVGPYDRRLGYVGLPGFVAALGDRGYEVESQARISQQFEWYFKRSGLAPYREKTQAGLALVAPAGQPIFVSRTPERAFDNFEAVPPLLVTTQNGSASCRERVWQDVLILVGPGT